MKQIKKRKTSLSIKWIGRVQSRSAIQPFDMCIEKFLYCIRHRRIYDIVPFRNDIGVLVVHDYLCGHPNCLRYHRAQGQQPASHLYYALDHSCGGTACDIFSCRAEKVIYDCQQTPPFMLRKYWIALLWVITSTLETLLCHILLVFWNTRKLLKV